MPVTPKYTWEQTLETLTVHIEIPGITRCRPDVFATSALLKVNALPYLFHLDLLHDVDDTQTAAAVTDQGVTFMLRKGHAQPQRVRLLARRASALVRLGDLPAATGDYKQALQLDPSNANIRHDLLEVQHCSSIKVSDRAAARQLADARLAAQDYAGAAEAYTALLHGKRAMLLRLLVRRGSALAHGKRYGEACLDYAATSAPEKTRPGEKKGFVEEMRFVAMRLHTKDQAPKEGQKPAENPWQKWQPTREGYLRFLTESKAVYEVLERIVEEASHPEYKLFRNTGLERSARLAQDVAWMQNEFRLAPVQLSEDGPGISYARLLSELAETDPQAFLCHFYNIYFAHTAGGRMIGTKVAGMLLDGRELEFYRYDGEVREKLDAVRERLNEVAEGWSREQKDRCLAETEKSFSYSGGLLRTIVVPAGEEA
ncbi:hypothetical protein WJX81_001029 [Elliptochloris bilobata]|uniref:heme oxygenase (biliverdin-producing) n=1 Tax=Elliptochloris bilobata TaxID=381761 RepID=A0AAW1S889_9CHLO